MSKRSLWYAAAAILAIAGIFTYKTVHSPRPEDTGTPPALLETGAQPRGTLAYLDAGEVKFFNAETGDQTSAGFEGMSPTGILWSNDGQLAVIAQGASGGTGFLGAHKALASTEGFKYIVFLWEPNGISTTLVSPLFGDVFWAADSSGLYVSENYFKGQPLLLGNQIEDQPDEVRTFFVSLAGNKSLVSSQEFTAAKLKNPGLSSPNGEYSIQPCENSDCRFDSVLDNKTGELFPIRPADNYSDSFNVRFSPDGGQVSFLYRLSDEAYKDVVIAGVANLSEILSGTYQNPQRVLSTGRDIDSLWLDSRFLFLVTHNVDPSNNASADMAEVYDSAASSFTFPFGNAFSDIRHLVFSPDKNLVAFERRNENELNEIVVARRDGAIVAHFAGESPAWNPAP